MRRGSAAAVLLVALWTAPALAAGAAAPVAGEYEGDFHGYLTVKPTPRPDRFKVWLGVGGGSCGGQALVRDQVGHLVGRQMKFGHRMNGRACTTIIAFSETGAHVSDTCIAEESEGSSTCALMGDYERVSR